MLGYIYLLINRMTQVGYVGQTALTPQRRLIGHLSEAKSGRHGNPQLKAVLRRYGVAGVIQIVLEQVEACSKEELRPLLTQAELHWIEHLPTLGLSLSNRMIPEDSRLGFTATQETRALQSKAKLGNQNRKGVPTSEAAKQSISHANKGKPSSWAGKTPSTESKAKMSTAHEGVPLSEEHRAAMKAAHARPETVQKKREARLGCKVVMVDGRKTFVRPETPGAAA